MERQDIDGELSTTGAQELLTSTSAAHLAYIGRDGTPRVIPVGFFWTGDQVVIAGSYYRACIRKRIPLGDGRIIADDLFRAAVQGITDVTARGFLKGVDLYLDAIELEMRCRVRCESVMFIALIAVRRYCGEPVRIITPVVVAAAGIGVVYHA